MQGVALEPQPGKAAEDSLDRDLPLQASQGRTNAKVDALTESDV
jgi:hypothetical protein